MNDISPPQSEETSNIRAQMFGEYTNVCERMCRAGVRRLDRFYFIQLVPIPICFFDLKKILNSSKSLLI